MAPTYEMLPGRGAHHTRDGRIVTAGGQVTVHSIDELGSGRDKFKLVEGSEPVKRDPRTFPVKVDGNPQAGFNLINGVTGRKINKKPMTAEEAFSLIGADVPKDLLVESKGELEKVAPMTPTVEMPVTNIGANPQRGAR